MSPRVLPLLVLVALAPAAGADVVHSGTLDTDAPHAPQFHCEIAQTEPRTRADPARCDLTGTLNAAMIIRARIVGTGHVTAFLMDQSTNTQIAQMECASPGLQQSCIRILPGLSRGTTEDNVGFHAFLYGPSPAVAVVTVERVTLSLP